jgi:hypothetical protein
MPNRKTSQETIDSVNEFFSHHEEELTNRARGQFEKLFTIYQELTGSDICRWTFKTLATAYRREHNLKFVHTSKYYKPKTENIITKE